ncbi:MAG: hypothetical protein V4544_03815 [Pseudomonadota bacterium]
MKLKFFLKFGLFVISMATHCFSVPGGSNDSISSGVVYIENQYAIRREDFTIRPEEIVRNSKQTDNIIKLLSDSSKVSHNHANEEEKRKILKAIIAGVLIHNGERKLHQCNLEGNHIFWKHFRILERGETLSILLNGILNVQNDGRRVLNDPTLNEHWSIFSELETYGGITKEMFALWFNETLEEHNKGFVVLVQNAEKQKKEQKQARIMEQQEQAQFIEEKRVDGIEAKQELVAINFVVTGEYSNMDTFSEDLTNTNHLSMPQTSTMMARNAGDINTVDKDSETLEDSINEEEASVLEASSELEALGKLESPSAASTSLRTNNSSLNVVVNASNKANVEGNGFAKEKHRISTEEKANILEINSNQADHEIILNKIKEDLNDNASSFSNFSPAMIVLAFITISTVSVLWYKRK